MQVVAIGVDQTGPVLGWAAQRSMVLFSRTSDCRFGPAAAQQLECAATTFSADAPKTSWALDFQFDSTVDGR